MYIHTPTPWHRRLQLRWHLWRAGRALRPDEVAHHVARAAALLAGPRYRWPS